MGNCMEITEPDGTLIKYWDSINNDLKLEGVSITKNKKTTEYNSHILWAEILDKAQFQFDGYLKIILEIKQAKGMSDLIKK